MSKPSPEKRREYYENWKQGPKYEPARLKHLQRLKEKRDNDPEYRDKLRKKSREYWKNNQEKVKERRRNSPKHKKSTKVYNDARRLKVRDFWLRQKYGISLDQFDEMSAKQRHKCAICGEAQKTGDKWNSPFRRLRVDHCHDTGKVRGLLCHHCNAGLGHFKDNPLFLQNAIDYLEKIVQSSSDSLIQSSGSSGMSLGSA